MPSHCKVSRIYFNYFQSNLRIWGAHSEYGMNVMPENISHFPTIPYNAVAFPIDSTKGKELKLHVEFKAPEGKLHVRTINPLQFEEFDVLNFMRSVGIQVDPDELPLQNRLLGDIDPVEVHFDEDGNSYVHIDATPANPVAFNAGVVELPINSADIWHQGINSSWQLWQWQYSTDKGKSWHNADGLFENGISVHRVFVTKSVATWPWTSFDEDAIEGINGQQLFSTTSYLEALEWACKWAKNETTEKGIVSKITMGLNNCNRFKYSLPGGVQNYTSFINNAFDCGRFIDRLNGRFGRGPNVNCVDCALMVVSLANILGCSLRSGRIRNSDNSTEFQLNPVILIGYDKEVDVSSFKYHQVTYSGVEQYSSASDIYDACIKFDPDVFEEVAARIPRGDPTNLHTEALNSCHPAGLPLGSNVFSFGYIAILAADIDQPSQTDIGMHTDTGDAHIFGIGSLKF